VVRNLNRRKREIFRFDRAEGGLGQRLVRSPDYDLVGVNHDLSDQCSKLTFLYLFRRRAQPLPEPLGGDLGVII
jgi:hypothetical protein